MLIESKALDPRELVLSASELGSPPVVYRRLMDVIENPRSGAGEVGAVISQDPSLTARLLRLVNSAFFAFGQRIETVGQAVSLVGMAQVRDLALATSVTSFFRDVPPDLIHQEDFWRHSLACGIGARLLARRRREPNVERFFVAGMLHDVGRLVLYMRAPLVARQVIEHAEAHGVLLHEAERELLGVDHGEIGAVLLRHWQISDSLAEAVAFHHRPTEAGEHALAAATVHVADIVANGLQLGRSGERRVPARTEEAWSLLQIDDGEKGLPEEVELEYGQVVKAFGLSEG